MPSLATLPELPVAEIKFCADPKCQATFSLNQKYCWRCGCSKSKTMEVPITANFLKQQLSSRNRQSKTRRMAMTTTKIIRIKDFSEKADLICRWIRGADQLGQNIDENGVFAIGITLEKAKELLASLKERFMGTLEIEVIEVKSKAA
jgi:hypothetical protein